MTRALQSIFYITALVFFLRGQFYLSGFDDTVPFLLSSIFMVLTAIYLKEDNKNA